MYHCLIGEPNKKTVVFLHGWGSDSSVFRGVISLLPKNECSYLLLDFEGFGKSDEPNNVKTVFDYAEDVIKLLDELNIKRASFVGHSFGGRIALILGALYKDRVEKLLIVDGAGVIVNRGIVYKIKVFKHKFNKKLFNLGIIKKVPKAGSSDYLALKSDVMRATFINVVNKDLLYLAKDITAKTYLVWGENDKDTPMKVANKLKAKIQNSELIVLKDAGHYSFVDKLQDFVYILYENIIL